MFCTDSVVPCVDWLRAIVPIIDVKKFIHRLSCIDSRLSLDKFIFSEFPLYNYRFRYSHQDLPSIKILYNPSSNLDYACDRSESNNPYILFELSGDGIRYLGSDSVKLIMQYFASVDFCGVKTKVTRIDLACDFFDKHNSIVPLMQDCFSHFINAEEGMPSVITSFKRDPVNWKCIANVYPKSDEKSFSYQIGHHGSDHGMYRLYDKKYEILYGRNRQISSDLLQDRDYWFRGELELHNSRSRQWANEAFYNLIDNDFNLYAIYGHCLSELFRFVSSVYIKDVSRSQISVVWIEFLEFLSSDIHFVQLVTEKFVDSSEERLWKYLDSCSTLFYVLEELKKSNPCRFNYIYHKGRDKLDESPQKQIKYKGIITNLKYRHKFIPSTLSIFGGYKNA